MQHVLRRVATPPLLLALLVTLSLTATPSRAAEGAGTARVEGRVVDAATGRGVEGATVSLPELGATVTSGPHGAFAFPGSFDVEGAYRKITAVVRAAGYGSWTTDGLPMRPGTALRLYAELGPASFRHSAVAAEELRAQAASQASTVPQGGNTCTAWDDDTVPPDRIRVRLTGQGVSRSYGFVFYVQHVLPSEWVPSWDPDSLRAGAVAVKTYAWYKAQPGQASVGGTDCADVYDTTQDQVFDPTYSYSTTDAAAAATHGSILRRDGAIFLAQYWSGAQGDPCKAVTTGPYPGRMSQWGTKTCADQGKPWPDIDKIFYTGTTFRNLYDLALDGGVESPHTFAWQHDSVTVLSRISRNAFAGEWWFKVTSPGGNGNVFQTRPYIGTSGTTYRASAALRCPTTNRKDCLVEFVVAGITSGGSSLPVSRKLTVPRDQRWHVYAFDATPGGGHVQARVRFESAQNFYIDQLSLKKS